MLDTTTQKVRGGARQGPRSTNGTGVVVADNGQQAYELRKATQALTVRNTSSVEISFLSRKAYNVMLQFAQEAIAASGDDRMIQFECSLKDFERRVGHTTPNARDYLKGILRQLMSIQVEFDYVSKRPNKSDGKSWGISHMVSEVIIDEDTAMLRWSFPPELSKRMLDPAIYNLIDLRTLMLFTSHSALALYEVVSRYFKGPSPRTFQDAWTGWSILLSGSSQPHKTYREFNKMLNRALAQVREVSPDYEITPHYTKTGKKINLLWFEIKPMRQPSLFEGPPPPAISAELERQMNEIGLAKDDIASLMLKYDEEYLLAQLDYTIRRNANKRQHPVANVTGYFMQACEKNFASTPLRPRTMLGMESDDDVIDVEAKEVSTDLQASSTGKSPLDTLIQHWRVTKLASIRRDLLAKPEAEQQAIVAALEPLIEKHSITAWRQYQKKGMAAGSVESVVCEILFAQQFPNDPTAEELLMFSLQSQQG